MTVEDPEGPSRFSWQMTTYKGIWLLEFSSRCYSPIKLIHKIRSWFDKWPHSWPFCAFHVVCKSLYHQVEVVQHPIMKLLSISTINIINNFLTHTSSRQDRWASSCFLTINLRAKMRSCCGLIQRGIWRRKLDLLAIRSLKEMGIRPGISGLVVSSNHICC